MLLGICIRSISTDEPWVGILNEKVISLGQAVQVGKH